MATVEKRLLTEEERAEAARLREAWLAFKQKNPGATQEWLGAATKLGSQGLVGQYLRGIIPLNLKALVAICSQIGVRSETVSPRLMSVFVDFNRAMAGEDDEQKTIAERAMTAALDNSEGKTNPNGNRPSPKVNKSFSQKLAKFKDEFARAEREGHLSEEKLDLLAGLLRLDSIVPPSSRVTVTRVLTENNSGQSDGRTKKPKTG